MSLRAWRSRWLLPVLALGMALQLVACGDKDAEQRKAFIALLESAQTQQWNALAALTEDQKKNLGPFVADYTVLTTFSRQVNQGMAGSLKPMLEQVSQIRTPPDFLTQRDALRQSVGAINLLGQQVQTAKAQAETAHRALKQPDDVKAVFDRVYAQVVIQPANALNALIPSAASLAQQLVQVGEYLQAQGNQVLFNGNRVQFATTQQVTHYNELVAPLAAQHQSLITGLQTQLRLVKP